MAARTVGKRVLRRRSKISKPSVGGSERYRVPAEKTQRRMRQLVISGTVFVLLVSAKLLLPEQMSGVREPVSQFLEQDMDVTAVFSAIGRAFSGEHDSVQDSLKDVYQAVFHPQSMEENPASSQTETPLRPPLSGEIGDTQVPRPIYSEENLPENVRLDQAVLGFEYCAPVTGTVNSEFGYREHPADGEERFHYGVDMVGEGSSSIAAFADGTVTVVGESSSYGKYLMLSHPDNYTTLYAHCSAIHVSAGQTVSMGNTIAEMGDTGQTTGVHLHFELQQDGVYLNPIYYVS